MNFYTEMNQPRTVNLFNKEKKSARLSSDITLRLSSEISRRVPYACFPWICEKTILQKPFCRFLEQILQGFLLGINFFFQ